jgi:hypothetical protein
MINKAVFNNLLQSGYLVSSNIVPIKKTNVINLVQKLTVQILILAAAAVIGKWYGRYCRLGPSVFSSVRDARNHSIVGNELVIQLFLFSYPLCRRCSIITDMTDT